MPKSPPRVSVVRLERYEPSAVEEALYTLLAPLGGFAAFVDAGAPALLKPNFLRPAVADSALTTHPEILRATAAGFRSAGATPVQISDSPGVGSATRCAKKLGLEMDGVLFQVVDADDPVNCTDGDRTFTRIRLSDRMLRSPALINVAKLKTHAQMGMTLTVKNLFGAVVGMDKAQWHYRAGRNPLTFAELVVRIYERLSPRLNILDGAVGMEGNGPGSGTPRLAGFLMASVNGHALDTAVCRALHIDPMQVFTLRAADRMGVFPTATPIEVVGEPLDSFKPKPSWKPARPFSTHTLGPRPISNLLEHLLSVAPTIDTDRCTVCRRCLDHCAAEAMHVESGVEKDAVRIDKKRCIACFCCQEICPEGAIHVKSSVLGRILGLGISRGNR